MTAITVYNTTQSPVTVDEAGRQVGGGEWASVETNPVVTWALADGRLVVVDPPTAGSNPDAAAAAQQTAAANSTAGPEVAPTSSDGSTTAPTDSTPTQVSAGEAGGTTEGQ